MTVVKVPVIGNVKQEFVYAGGALIVGIVGYAWWTKGGGNAQPAVLLPEAATDFTPPTVVDGNIDVGGNKPTPVPGAAQSNQEWLTQAMDMGAALGYARETLNVAFQKYLGKQPLSLAEVALIGAVVAVIGVPPQNGPFSLIPTSLPPPPDPHNGDTLPAPAGFNPVGISPTQVVLQWTRVTGAVTYQVRRDNEVWNSIGSVERITVPAPADQRDHTYQVRAVDSHGKAGAAASGTAKTIPQSEVNANLAHYAGR